MSDPRWNSGTPPSSYPNVGSSRSGGSSGGGVSYPKLAKPVNDVQVGVKPPPPVQAGPGQPGIHFVRVVINPSLRMAPPAQLVQIIPEIPHRTLQMDFDLEKKIIEDAERSGLEERKRAKEESQSAESIQARNLDLPSSYPPPPPVPTFVSKKELPGDGLKKHGDDAIVQKYVSLGLQPDVVRRALSLCGDFEPKVIEFCSSFTQLREMGFNPASIGQALLVAENDHERAIAILLTQQLNGK